MTSHDGRSVGWHEGTWSHPPVDTVTTAEGDLAVTAQEGSDAWLRTSYDFINDSEHALLAPLAHGSAVEVEFTADFEAQFDQAGVFLRAGGERWVKAGLELADGVVGAGAVVTDRYSDWSVGAVPEWPRQARVRTGQLGGGCPDRASRCRRRAAAPAARGAVPGVADGVGGTVRGRAEPGGTDRALPRLARDGARRVTALTRPGLSRPSREGGCCRCPGAPAASGHGCR